MFSEYASRFLAQSQSRMSAIRDGRMNNNQAPLFFSAADHVHEDRDEEVQDFYTLQSSRRHFGAYAASSVAEGEEEGMEESNDSIPDPRRNRGKLKHPQPQNINSSWKTEASTSSAASSSSPTASAHSQMSKGKDKLVDIGLDDSVCLGLSPDEIDHSDMIDHPSQSEHIAINMPADHPSQYQSSDQPTRGSAIYSPSRTRNSKFMPRLSSPSREAYGSTSQPVPGPVAHPPPDPPAHDSFWSSLYVLNMAGMFAAGFVAWLHTEDDLPSTIKDTVYKAIQHSVHALTVDTIVAVGISLAWFYLLRRYVKVLIYLLILGVPIVLIVLTIYPLVQSYRGEGSMQDKAMRWSSLAPFAMAATWVWVAYRGRNALGRAVGIIQLSCKILGENPALILLSFATLLGTIAFTWIWIGMFQRIFLNGSVGTIPGIWVMDSTTWFLAAYFVIMYLWTLGVVAGFQRATTAATVSQWYYYRHAIPTTPSAAVMSAALHHSVTILFGTICFSSFAALMIRLPILVVPRRIAGFIHLFCFNFIASPITALTHPLTLTYAAIHSQPLIYSSRAISSMRFIDASGFGGPTHHPRTAYRLSKMLLTATRTIVALAMGLGAWVKTARDPHGGSLYAYIVGMIAGFIGWGVLGATEGCLGNIVDACLVCVGSEGPEGGHCREAQMVFGG